MKNCKGNVLVLVLIAVSLLAALTFAISRDGNDTGTARLDAAQSKIYAAQLIRHATAAEMSVQQMEQWGITYDQILFDKPTDAGYSSNTSQQIYHPSGGGLAVMNEPNNLLDGNGTTGWSFQGNNNVEWSDSASTDFIFSFINLDADICAQINEKLRGNTTIPISTVNFTNTFTEDGTDANFTIAQCAACENVKSQCISEGTTNAFYTIIGAR